MIKSILKAVLILTVILPLASQAQKKQKTIIRGSLGDKATYTQIFLDTLNSPNPWLLTSSPLDASGNFVLEIENSKTEMYRLRLDDRNFMVLIAEPGEQITITVQGSKLGGDVKVDGSIHTQLLYQVMNMLQSYDNQGKALNQKYNEAQSSPKRDSLAALIINQMTQLDTEKKQNFMSLAEKNPSSLAWIFPLYLQKSIDMSEDFAFLDKIEAAMYKANPDNQFMKTFHQQTDVERKTAIGFPAPDIALSDADGNIRKLSSLKGKVVLVDFWASWCGPCRKENPNVVAIYNKYHDKGFEIYSVSLDKDRDSWLKAIAKDNLLWPNHVSDLKYWKSEGAAIYGVSSIPYTVLIDRKGKIVAKRLRGEDLEKKIAELLK